MRADRSSGTLVISELPEYMTGEPTNQSEAPDYEELNRLITEPENVVLDLGHTRFMNSATLGLLVRIRDAVLRKGCRIALCALDNRLVNTFTITRLTLVFDIYRTREEALAALAIA